MGEIPSQMAFISAILPYIDAWREDGLTWKEIRDRVALQGLDISVAYLQAVYSKLRRDRDYYEALHRVHRLENELLKAQRRADEANERLEKLLVELDTLRRQKQQVA
jgi:DNA-binding transcriptional MerR regulator